MIPAPPETLPQRLRALLTTRPLWLLVIIAAAAFSSGLLTPVADDVRGPIVDINDTVLIAVLIAFGGIVAQLYLRMGKLEADLQAFRKENDGLRSDLAAATSFINRLGLWMAQGSPLGRQPRPPRQLDEHIDAMLWADDSIGGTD